MNSLIFIMFLGDLIVFFSEMRQAVTFRRKLEKMAAEIRERA